MSTPTPPAFLADAGLVVFVALGALGGVHCLGMCGPLVATYADRVGGAAGRDGGAVADGGTGTSVATSTAALDWRAIRQHLLFNLGRTAGYALVGGVLGAIGGLAYDAAAVLAAVDGVRGVAGVAVGLVVAAVGVGYLRGGQVDLTRWLPLPNRALTRATAVLTARVDRWVRGPRIAGLGAAHALLPCPILYPAYLYALAVGSAAAGATALAAVGIGTFPTLFLYGTALGGLSGSTRTRLHRALGVVFVALAYLPFAHGMGLLGVELPHPMIPVFRPW